MGQHGGRLVLDFFVLPCCSNLGSTPVWEMVFPDDLRESNPGTFKFLQMAQAWRAQGSSILRPSPSSGPGQPSEPRNAAMDEDDPDELSLSGATQLWSRQSKTRHHLLVVDDFSFALAWFARVKIKLQL